MSDDEGMTKSEPVFSSFALRHFAGIFLGNADRIFAAAMKPMPIAIKKNEKNWPRVKGPINLASGSRKYSITIRKIA